MRVKEKRQKEALEKRFEGVETQEEFKQEKGSDEKDKVLRTLPLDADKFMPDREQRYW